ncbi:MAG: carbohydrate kinase family protein [Armatimonadota bacterium]
MPRFDVCSLGCVCWDLTATVKRYPALDEKVPLEEFTQHGGGRSGTAAAACAALGGTTAIFGRIGDDTFGEYISEEFERQGVDTCGLQVIAGETSQFAFCVAHEPTGKRTIFYKHGSFERMEADDVDLQLLTDCRCLLVDTHHIGAAIAGAQAAGDRGVPTVMDAERPQEGLMELIGVTDHVIIPFHLAETLGEGDTDAGVEVIMQKEPESLVLTRGEQGADVYTGEGSFHQPAYEVPTVIDTTGAGDVFHGAFAYGISQGLDFPETVAFASATAALSTTALGGRGHLPSSAEVRALMEGLSSLCSR